MNPCPILYAEDEEDDVYFLQRAFRDAGVPNPLSVVADGQLAIDYLAGDGPYEDRTAHPLPCLAILDLKMPKQSGLEVLKWIRAQPSLCTLPVIMLTSSSHDVDMHRAYIQGANGYLIKPTNPAELSSMAKAIKDYWLTQNRSVHQGA
jgi:CheY-like chemotaxis protein